MGWPGSHQKDTEGPVDGDQSGTRVTVDHAPVHDTYWLAESLLCRQGHPWPARRAAGKGVLPAAFALIPLRAARLAHRG